MSNACLRAITSLSCALVMPPGWKSDNASAICPSVNPPLFHRCRSAESISLIEQARLRISASMLAMDANPCKNHRVTRVISYTCSMVQPLRNASIKAPILRSVAMESQSTRTRSDNGSDSRVSCCSPSDSSPLVSGLG